MCSRSLLLSSVLLATGALGAGCATDNAGDPSQAGAPTAIQVPLLRQSGTNIYRLNATFQVTQPDGSVITVDGTGDASVVTIQVSPGVDKIEILDGWTIERSTDGGQTFAPAKASLASARSVSLIVSANTTVFWEFDFIISDGTTTLSLGFGVFDAPSTLSLELVVTGAFGAFKGYTNQEFTLSVPFVGTSFTQIAADGSKERGWAPGLTTTQLFGDKLGLLAPVFAQFGGGFMNFTVAAHADGTEDLDGSYQASFREGGTFPTLTFAASQLFGRGTDADGFPIDAQLFGFGGGFVLTNNGTPILTGVVNDLSYAPGSATGQM